MNRFHATVLVVVYSMFSCFAVGSTHVYAEATSESSEKEVVISSFPEHKEERSVRFSTNSYRSPFKNINVYHYHDEKPKDSSLRGFSVPFYILHCVYRR